MPKNDAEVMKKIIAAGFSVIQVTATEFMKAGGSLRCLSLNLTK
jgi:N-dimethylarginine dimethylaminohydrolase